MKFLPWMFIFILAITFAFISLDSNKDIEKTNIKVYQDTIVFGDSVSFICTRCKQLNVQYVYVRIIIPKCN